MATITIPDELKSEIESRAAESGYASVDKYVAAVLRAEAATSEAELEGMLVQRLESGGPGVELTPEFVERFKRDVQARRESRGQRP
jgi:hypothetical protein